MRPACDCGNNYILHGRWTSLKTYSSLVVSAARKDKQELVHQDGTSMPGAAAPGKYPVNSTLMLAFFANSDVYCLSMSMHESMFMFIFEMLAVFYRIVLNFRIMYNVAGS